MLVWFHILLNIIMLLLDAAWWVAAMWLCRKPLLRICLSLFMVLQLAAITNELVGRLGVENFDVRHVPKFVLSIVTLWHYFALPALSLLGFTYVCVKIFRRYRVKKIDADVGTNATEVPANSPEGVSRRQFLGACAALTPPLLTFGLAGISVAQLNHFRVRRFTLSLAALPRQLDGLTIAHITDIHVGEWTRGKVLRDMVNTTNSLNADLVLMTGDLINYDLADLPEAIDLIKAMPGKYGHFMVEGNHDLFESGFEFERRVKAAGLPLLLDETVVSNVRGYPVQFFGLRWMEAIGKRRDLITSLQMEGLMRQRHPDAFPILLAHHPHAFDAAIKADLPLTLTGHTHGGQLMLDSKVGVGPTLFRYWSGKYQRNTSQLIVSNGVGNMFPIRVNAPAEIVHLTLRCA